MLELLTIRNVCRILLYTIKVLSIHFNTKQLGIGIFYLYLIFTIKLFR